MKNQGGEKNEKTTSSISGNTDDNYGIYLLTVSGNVVSGNIIATNGTDSNYGIHLRDSANNNT